MTDEPLAWLVSLEGVGSAFAAARDGDAALGGKGVAVQLTARNGDQFVTHVLPLTTGARRQAGGPYSALAAVFVQRAGNDTAPSLDRLAVRKSSAPASIRSVW